VGESNLRILNLGFQPIRKISTMSQQWRHYRVKYLLGESDSGLFGGNSNLRGPVWMPAKYLLVETVRRFQQFYADGLKIECPTGSRIMLTLNEVADDVYRAGGASFMPEGCEATPHRILRGWSCR
jgi:hypothetical protein